MTQEERISAKEFWKLHFGEYPKNDKEKLAVSMMQEYAGLLLPQLEECKFRIGFLEDNKKEILQQLDECKEQLAVTEKLLEERQRVLDAIPECPAHGGSCVPHALEWITGIQMKLAQAKKELDVMIGNDLRQEKEIESLNQQIGQVKESLLFANDEIESLKQENERLKELIKIYLPPLYVTLKPPKTSDKNDE